MVLLIGCLATVIQGAPAVAQPMTVDRGYLSATGSRWVGPGTQAEMLLGGERGFTYFGVSRNLNFGPAACAVPRCWPGSILSLFAYSMGDGLAGTATLEGVLYAAVGCIDGCDAQMEVAFSGETMLPPLASAATVSAPFAVVGTLTTERPWPERRETFSGSGTATLFLEAGTGEWIGTWRVTRVTYDIGPVLPLPWSSAAVADDFPRTSAVLVSPDSFRVSGVGTDIWDSSDAFRFLYQRVDRGGAITARIVTARAPGHTAADLFAKAGVMIRESLDPGSPHVILNMTPGGILEFMTRSAAGQPTVFVASAWAPPEDTRLQLSRDGDTITGRYSVLEGDWQEIGSVATALGQSPLIGLAVTSHDPDRLYHALFSDVHVSTLVGPPNLIDNGDFESYAPPALGLPGWVSDDPFRQAAAKSETHQPRSGTQNGACWTPAFLDCGLYQELRAPVTGSYQLTVYATADRRGGLVGANVNDGLAATAAVDARDFGNYGEPSVMVFRAQVGDAIRVWMYSPATPGYVVIDDVSLTVEDAR